METKGEDEEGIKGFLPKDMLKEWHRGNRLKCSYCDKGPATVGCCAKGCKKTYHLYCGMINGSLQQFTDSYPSFCKDHRPLQSIYQQKLTQAQIRAKRECGMCFEAILRYDFCQFYLKCSQNSVKIQLKYSQNSVKIQSKFS